MSQVAREKDGRHAALADAAVDLVGTADRLPQAIQKVAVCAARLVLRHCPQGIRRIARRHQRRKAPTPARAVRVPVTASCDDETCRTPQATVPRAGGVVHAPWRSARLYRFAKDARGVRLSTLGAASVFAERGREFMNHLRMSADLQLGGALLLAGTDADNTFPFLFFGFSLHDELSLLVKGGLTPLAALQCATINPARFLGREAELGTVTAGKLADLVLLDANPMENIEHTKRITAVVANGRYLSRADLDTLLDRAAAMVKRSCGVGQCGGVLRLSWSAMQPSFKTRRHHHIPAARRGEERRDAADAPQQISASVSQLSLGHRSSEAASGFA
ncbi:MAG: amidohydrolase family protein [Gemmatimonadaceae bacterium]|nr:amidohydrolase family protein [Gemmatimonadaceae bacterium]